MITLTHAATQRINKNIQRRGAGVGIRLGVRTTGCSGLAYTIEYVDNYTAQLGDTNYAQPDFCVLVDAKSQAYLLGMTVDYVRKGLNEGFEFVNPNERDRCGCGSSFRV